MSRAPRPGPPPPTRCRVVNPCILCLFNHHTFAFGGIHMPSSKVQQNIWAPVPPKCTFLWAKGKWKLSLQKSKKYEHLMGITSEQRKWKTKTHTGALLCSKNEFQFLWAHCQPAFQRKRKLTYQGKINQRQEANKLSDWQKHQRLPWREIS